MSPKCGVVFLGKGDGPTSGFDTVALAKCIIKDERTGFLADGARILGVTSLPDITVVVEDRVTARLSVSVRDSTPPYNILDQDSQYPACFRIPPGTLHDVPEGKRREHALRFAVGSLIYTIMANKEPFAGLDEDTIQDIFERGIYPGQESEFDLEILVDILEHWSREFRDILNLNDGELRRQLLAPRRSRLSKVGLGVGLGVFAVAALVVPILGAVGFSALGPVAGSAAAGWQSGIGLVQAGSFFAWCQSAAMGGAAAATIAGVQGAGLSVVGLSALQSIYGGVRTEAERRLHVWNLFKDCVRKGGKQ